MRSEMRLSLDELTNFAREFVKSFPHMKGSRAHVVGLSGDLGSGKTAFVQRVAKELGVSHHVTSPTFTLLQSYPTLHPVFRKLVHVDAYRLSPDESDTIGWGEYLSNPENLILVEWPERLSAFPKDVPQLHFNFIDHDTREITSHVNAVA
jgi:tRNA threonylcarbamoyladenosine biosynthesis protein TsaE